jgi:hypothetical protein
VSLRHVADPRPVAEVVRGRPEKGDGAGQSLVEAEDALHQGRLARTVGAEDRDDLTAIDGETRAGDDGALAVPERRVLQLDDGGHEQSCPCLSVARLLRITSK